MRNSIIYLMSLLCKCGVEIDWSSCAAYVVIKHRHLCSLQWKGLWWYLCSEPTPLQKNDAPCLELCKCLVSQLLPSLWAAKPLTHVSSLKCDWCCPALSPLGRTDERVEEDSEKQSPNLWAPLGTEVEYGPLLPRARHPGSLVWIGFVGICFFKNKGKGCSAVNS